MDFEWAEDFSYDYFKKILNVIKKNFELHFLSDAPKIINKEGKPKIILRHDVDISLKRALKMAEIEKKFNVRSSYMIRIDSPLYNVEDKSSKNIILKIMSAGHEIGLHFNFQKNCEIELLDKKIFLEAKKLEEIINSPILSFSFHCPFPQFLYGPLFINGKINAYSKELMKWYLSDSKCRWRGGEPLIQLLKPKKQLLQLLIHPIWWGEKHLSPEDRLQEFFEKETKGKSFEYTKAFDSALADPLLGVYRRGLKKEEIR